jgi:hypothetical protein
MTETALGLIGGMTMVWSGLLVGWTMAEDRRSYRVAIEELALSLAPLIDLKPPEAVRAAKIRQPAKPRQATGLKPKPATKLSAGG